MEKARALLAFVGGFAPTQIEVLNGRCLNGLEVQVGARFLGGSRKGGKDQNTNNFRERWGGIWGLEAILNCKYVGAVVL